MLPSGSGVQLGGQGWHIQIANTGNNKTGTKLPAGIQVSLYSGATTQTSGTGFLPGSTLNAYLFSTRVLLGTAIVKADGKFTLNYLIKSNTALGNHVLQFEGTGSNGKSRTAAVGLRVTKQKGNNLIPLTTIHYALNISDLNAANRAVLNSIVTAKVASEYKVIWVYSYTDSQTGVNNLALSKFRAVKVVAYLHAKFPKLELKYKLFIIKYKFFGPANPVNNAHTQAAYAQNRRSEIYGQK